MWGAARGRNRGANRHSDHLRKRGNDRGYRRVGSSPKHSPRRLIELRLCLAFFCSSLSLSPPRSGGPSTARRCLKQALRRIATPKETALSEFAVDPTCFESHFALFPFLTFRGCFSANSPRRLRGKKALRGPYPQRTAVTPIFRFAVPRRNLRFRVLSFGKIHFRKD